LTLSETVAELGHYLERWEAFGFSGAVLVAQGDRILLSRGYGKADRSANRPVAPETLFDIGSLSKQFTAAAILVLAEEGRLDIEGSISQVLDAVPQDKAPITVYHLLTHTAGIGDGYDVAEPSALSRDDLVEEILARPLTEAPGTGYAYSNDGYSLLAAIVERAAGEPFEQYLTRRLFEPAGLRRSTFAWNSTAADAHVALGYGGYRAAMEGEDPRTRARTWRGRGSGNVLSSTEDLLKWYRALRSGRILGCRSLREMFTPHATAEAEFLSYGYGWRSQSTADGGQLVWHSGLDEAYSSMFRHYVDEDIVLIFLSNQSVGGVPMREIFVPPSRSGPPVSDLFAQAITAAPPYIDDEARLTRYAGHYRVGRSGWWSLEVDGSAVVLNAEGQEAIDALFPPDEASVRIAYSEVNAAAEELARCLAAASCRTGDVDRIDPLGYAARSGAQVLADWQRQAERLGGLRGVRALGTTGLRGPNPDQKVTHVRLDFADGVVDEHVIWFADDEIYWISGRPATLALRFKPAPGGGLVGFDLLQQSVYHLDLSDDGRTITATNGGRTRHGSRTR
jgi:CubicO group peptidase (beta-lactamase class C family)